MAIDKLRLLIALAVLKNKPKDQTPSTYILSLQEAFPSCSTITNNFWESHARQLERECIGLRATLGDLQIQSFLDANADPIVKPTQLTVTSALPSSLESSSLPVPSGGGNKKSKKKSKSNGGEAVEQDSLANVLKQGKTTFGSGKLFQSLDIFLQLWIRHSLNGFQRSGFFVATREVFKALAEFFKEATKKQSDLKSMRTLQVALCSVIDKAVPLAASWLIDDEGALSLFFEQLLDILITIVIPSFISVSESNLGYLRNVDPSASNSASSVANYADARVSILALFQSALVHVRSALPVTGGDRDTSCAAPNLRALARADFSVMIHSLLLADIRHLQDILRDNEGQSVARTRSQRIKRLAVKDTFWYLCSVAHFLLGLQSRTPSALFAKPCEPIDSELRQISLMKLLRQAIIDLMDDVVIYQDRVRARAYTASYGRVFKEAHVSALYDDFGPEFLTNKGASKPMDYMVLDDLEYRMFLRLVERFIDMPSMP